MNAVTTLLQDEGVLRLGRTLLHFAWQGAAGALLAGGLLIALRGASAAARYVALLVVFAALAACPVATFLALPDGGSAAVSSPAAALQVERPDSGAGSLPSAEPQAAPFGATSTAAPGSRPGSLIHWLEPRLGWLAAAWALGVLALSLRLAIGWVRLHQTRRAARDVIEQPWQRTLATLSERLRISRPVRLLHSAGQQAPMVMGWLRPVILLPATAMTGLTPAQFEAVIAHELAHIRRHDYVVNLVQTVVETLLFYHPAVWWLSNRIRGEREHCCDDIAVEVCGDAAGYARALTELEELRGSPRPAVGAGGPLLSRIRRLVYPLEPRVDVRASWLAAGLVLAVLLGLGVMGKVTSVAAETTAPPSALAAAQEAFDRGVEAAARSASGEAIEHFDEALRHLEEVEESEAAKRLRMAVLWEKGGAVRSPLGAEHSLACFLEALSLSEELEDEVQRARRTMLVGSTYASNGQEEKFDEYTRRAAELFREAGDAAGQGECLFWLGTRQLSAGEAARGRGDLEQAYPLLQKAGSHALAGACEAGFELLDSVEGEGLAILSTWAMATTALATTGGRVSLVGDSGFVVGSYGGDSPLVVASPFSQISHLRAFLDGSVAVGESWSGEAFSYTYQPLLATVTVISASERVTVPAGTFANCLLTEQVTTESDMPDAAPDRRKELNRSALVGTRRAWYAPGVGLVRLEVTRGDGVEAMIELREYTISGGGQGYLPLVIGNSWTYGWAGVPLDSAREVYRVTSREGDTWHLAHYERIRREALEARATDTGTDNGPVSAPEGATAPIVHRIQFEGLRELTADELLAVMKTKPGSPYDVKAIARDAQAIEDLCRSRGYVLAMAGRPRLSDDEPRTVMMLIREGEIEDIVVRGTDEQHAAAVLEAISTSVGDVYNDKAVTRDLAELGSLSWIESVRRDVEVGAAPGKVILVFTVTPRETGASETAVHHVFRAIPREVGASETAVHHEEVVYDAFRGAPREAGASETAAHRDEMIYDVIDLRFLDATYVAWLFGRAELPTDWFFLPRQSSWTGSVEDVGPDAAEAAGVFREWLPDGIEVLAPAAHGSRQLVVSGTPDAIAHLREFIDLIDQRPRQIVLELTAFSGLPTDFDDWEWLAVDPGSDDVALKCFPSPWDPMEPPSEAKEVDQFRVATMNLVPTINTLPDGLLFVASPRINGDGSITLVTQARRPEREIETASDFEGATAAASRLPQAVVNVQDGETVGLAFHLEDSWQIVIVTPRIVSDKGTE
jgi:beta-lactamase regulating signal transducer with metallopeptidase domain